MVVVRTAFLHPVKLSPTSDTFHTSGKFYWTDNGPHGTPMDDEP
jgi:hypothetical protein